MGTKLFSTWVTLSWMLMLGCGGKISEAPPSDAHPADTTVAEGGVEGDVVLLPPATPGMASSDEHANEDVPGAEPLPEGDGGAAAAADSPPEPEQPPSFCGGRATSVVRVKANLDANAQALNTAAIEGPPPIAAQPFDPQAPANTANFSTSVTIYDSLGVAHSMEIYFRNSDTEVRTWDYHVLLSGADVVGEILDGNVEVGGGTLRFARDGALSSDSGSPLTIAFRNTPVSSTIEVDFAGRTRGIVDGTTNVAGYSNVTSQFQDGYAASWGSGPCVPPPRSPAQL